jgi:hypothetical protein
LVRYYAGVGSRYTPGDVCELMTDVAKRLAGKGFHLRSGGAVNADHAFACGAPPTQRTLYIPWRGFNEVSGPDVIIAPDMSNWELALTIAEECHTKWEACSQGARKLLARNTYQILGDDLHTPVEFVIGWTKRGAGQGGTGQAYRVAGMLPEPPPIYDLGHPDVLRKFQDGWLPV